MKNLVRYVGLRHFRLRPARSILTTLGVAFGIALYVAIAIINASTRNSFRENVEAVSGKAKITISAGATGFEEELLETIRGVPGVAYAVPLIESRAFFDPGFADGRESIYVIGVDMLQESAVRTYKATNQEIIDDPLIFLNQPDSIVVTKKFADAKGLKIDSKLPLATVDGMKTFTVRGLLEPEGAAKAYGGSLAVMDIDGARVSFGKVGKIDRVDVIPEAKVAVEDLISRLSGKLGSGFVVERPETQSESAEKMIETYQHMITFFGSLALLVGLFLVFNSVSISVAERRREIGVLRALGASRNSILAVFVIESAVMGAIGAASGSFLGRFLADGMVKQVTTSLSAQFHTPIEASHLELTPNLFLFAFALGTITSAAAAFLPAFRASRISPLEAMKKDEIGSKRERSSRRAHFAGAFFLVFTYVSLRLHWNRVFAPTEQLTQVASVLGAAFFGPFVVFWAIRSLRRILKVKRAPVLRLAQDNLLRSPRRTSTNIMALMVGLFLVMLIATVRASFQDTLTTWLGDILTADIVVTGSGRAISAEVQPIKAEIQEELLKVPGVRQPGPGRGTASRMLGITSQGVKYAVKAFDHPADFLNYGNFMIKDRNRVETAKELFDEARNAKEPGVIVSENYFFKHPDKKTGDLVEIDTPSGRTAFRILAVCVDYASANGVFYFDRRVYRHYWKDPYVTSFALSLEPGADLEKVRSAISAGVGRKHALLAVSNAEMRKAMSEAIDQGFAYTRAVEAAALLVALLGLLNTLLISVMERTRELGVLRAIGSSRRQIFRMILIESLIQGGFGAVVAVAIGSFVAKVWIEESLAHSLGWAIRFYVPYTSVLTTIGVGVLVSMIAGLYPSKRASDIPIVEALDYE